MNEYIIPVVMGTIGCVGTLTVFHICEVLKKRKVKELKEDGK